MFSTSEIELVETTITVTTQSSTTTQGLAKEYTTSHLIDHPQSSTCKKCYTCDAVYFIKIG